MLSKKVRKIYKIKNNKSRFINKNKMYHFVIYIIVPCGPGGPGGPLNNGKNSYTII